MPQLNVPRKIVCTSQFWISAGLILLALIFCLTPIVTLKPFGDEDSDSKTNTEFFADFVDEMNIDINIKKDINDEVQVTFPKLIGSVGLIVNMVQAAGGDDDAQEALEEKLDSKEGKEQVGDMIALVAVIVNTFDFEEFGENPIGMIFSVMISITAIFYVLGMVFALPITVIIIAIKSIIKVCQYYKTPENASSELSGKLTAILPLILMTKLFMGVISAGGGRIVYEGTGLTMLFVLSIISIVFNFVATRLRTYPAKQFKYLNIVQPVAIVGLIGFLVFFGSLCNSGIIAGFFGDGGNIMAMIEDAFANEDMGSIIAPVVIMTIYIGLAIGSMGYLGKIARRLTCSVEPEGPKGLVGLFVKSNVSDNNIVNAITNLFVFILPTIAYSMVDSELENASGILAGAIVMIIAEIAAIVLRVVFCKDLTENDMQEVLTGTAMSTEEKVAEAQRFVAENAAFAPVQNDVFASAPVQEPVAAPAQEESAASIFDSAENSDL